MTIPPIGNDSSASAARTRLSDNFDTFLVLLTAQLQNQDPLAPMDSTQFTQQLVQFSQVEQQIHTNEQLEALLANYQAMSASLPLSYIGRFAVIDTDATYKAGDQAVWAYTFERSPEAVTLDVLDASGRVVRSMAGVPAAGSHNFVWDGANDFGEALADGRYRLRVRATDAAGASVPATINAIELVSGVDLSNTPPRIIARSGAHDLGAIKGILDYLS